MKYLLPLFLLSLVLGEFTRIQLPNSVAFHLFDIPLLLLVLHWARKKKTKYKLVKPIVVFIGVGVISLLLNVFNFQPTELVVGSLYLVRWVFYSLLYFIVKDLNKDHSKSTLKYMTIAGGIFVVLGLLQYFLYPALRNLYYLGWDEHLMRLFSTFLDPNFAGAFISCFIVFLLVMRNKLPINQAFVWSLSGLSVIALILTYSRGAFLMFIVSVLTYVFLTKQYKLLGLLFGASILLFVILSPNFNQEGTNLLRTTSIFQRTVSIKEGLNVFEKSPVFGVGFNTYRYAREDLGFKDNSKFGPSHSAAGVESSFVFIMATTGIVGLVVFLFLLYSIFKLGLQKTNKGGLGLVLVCSLAGLTVNAMVINSLFFPFLMVWIWLLAGLTENS